MMKMRRAGFRPGSGASSFVIDMGNNGQKTGGCGCNNYSSPVVYNTQQAAQSYAAPQQVVQQNGNGGYNGQQYNAAPQQVAQSYGYNHGYTPYVPPVYNNPCGCVDFQGPYYGPYSLVNYDRFRSPLMQSRFFNASQQSAQMNNGNGAQGNGQ